MDLTAYRVTGTNNPDKQVSVDRWNNVLTAIERGVDSVSVLAHGASADNVTDDLAAFQAALAALDAAGGGRLIIPAGTYYLSDTLNINQHVHIQGEGYNRTILRFGKNCNGIVFNHEGSTYTTTDDTITAAGGGTAEGSSLSDIYLYGGNVDADASGTITSYNAGDSTTGHGVRIRTTYIHLNRVRISFFGGDGFNINATSGGANDVQGNANTFLLSDCTSIYNRGNGLLINGNDANAGTTINFSAIHCGGSGIMDWSFLGNTHIQPHTRDCGVDDPTVAGTGTGGPTGTCIYNSVYYYVVSGQTTAASTTEPGTDSSVWRTFPGHPYCKTWQTGMTWVVGAPYSTNHSNVNARNVFVGAYAEAAQAPVQGSYPTLFLGGLLDEVGLDTDCTAVWIKAGLNGLEAKAFYSAVAAGKYTRLGSPSDATIWLAHNDGTSEWDIKDDGSGNAVFRRATSEVLKLTASGPKLVGAGRLVDRSGNNILGDQQGAIANHASDATVNSILTALRNHGLIAT